MADILSLGGIIFRNFSPPEKMPWGGHQTMAAHKLLGGSRVIDTMGPDDRNLSWSGCFFGNDALATAQALDALRVIGQPLPLSWGAMAAVVVISEFLPDMRRWPVYIDYSITCVVQLSGASGALGFISAGVDALISADLGAMAAILG